MKRDTKFKPGQSGNPRGRAKGAGEIAKLRASIASHVPEIITRLVEAAKGGDAAAARLLLERVLPAVKPVEQAAPVTLPADGTLTDQARAILRSAAAGEIAPSQASQLLAGLGALASLIETDELASRITALEKHREKP